MRRVLPIATLVLALMVIPAFAQRGGGHGGFGGGHGGFSGGHAGFGGGHFGGGFSGHSFGGGFAGHSFGGTRSYGGTRASPRMGARSFGGNPYLHDGLRGPGFGNGFRTFHRPGFAGPDRLGRNYGVRNGWGRGRPGWHRFGDRDDFYRNRWGWGWNNWGWGYPWGWGYADYWPWWWDQDDYEFDQPQADQIAEANAMNQESLYEQQMRDEEQQDQDAYAQQRPEQDAYARPDSASARQAKQPEKPATPTVLVFRDNHQQEVNNYAIVNQTLWTFSSNRTQKIPLSDLNIPATVKANDDRGVDFDVPHSGQ